MRPFNLSTALAYPYHLPNGKTSSFVLQTKDVSHHRMQFSSSKCVKMLCARASPRTTLGSLQRSPRPPRWITGDGRAGKGKGGREREGTRRRGQRGKEGERREQGHYVFCAGLRISNEPNPITN